MKKLLQTLSSKWDRYWQDVAAARRERDMIRSGVISCPRVDVVLNEDPFTQTNPMPGGPWTDDPWHPMES